MNHFQFSIKMFGLDTDTVRNIKQAFAKIPDIDKVILYGSRAKGNYRNGSDIDITLFGEKLTLDNSVYPLMDELEELCLPYMFDISIFADIDNEDLVEHINLAGKVFYLKDVDNGKLKIENGKCEERGLPKGWEIKKLGEVCEVKYGERVVQKRDGGTIYPVYGGGGATFHIDKTNRKDCLVIARFAMSVQCTRFVNGEFFLNDSGLSVEPKNTREILQKFLDLQFFYLNDHIYSLARGTAQKNLNVPVFRNIEIHYPKSLPEQKRIVAILDQAFTAIASAKANAEQNLKNARELFQSKLQTEFANGKLKIESGEWEEKKLGDVCEVRNGGTPKTGNTEYWGGNIKWLTPKDMGKLTSKYAYDTSKKITLLGLRKSSAKLIPANSVILSTRAPIGHLAINTFEMATNQGCRGIIPAKDISNEYLFYFLNRSVDLLNNLGVGATFKELSAKALLSVEIPLPPLPEQKRIVKTLDSLSTETKKLETIYQQKIDDLDELKKSILQKAFNGEL